VHSTITSPFIGYGLEHQPNPRGWAESSPQYMSRVRPSPGWLAMFGLVFFLLKEKFKKYFLKFYNFPAYFYVILINIKQYFYVAKNTKFDIKILGFRQNFQNTKKN